MRKHHYCMCSNLLYPPLGLKNDNMIKYLQSEGRDFSDFLGSERLTNQYQSSAELVIESKNNQSTTN